MKELFSIRAREVTYRYIIIGLLGFSLGVAGISIYYANSSIEEGKKNIYILKNDKALIRAQSIDLPRDRSRKLIAFYFNKFLILIISIRELK